MLAVEPVRPGSRGLTQPRVLAHVVADGGRSSKVWPTHPRGDRIRALVHPSGGATPLLGRPHPRRVDAAASFIRFRLSPPLPDDVHRNVGVGHVPAPKRWAASLGSRLLRLDWSYVMDGHWHFDRNYDCPKVTINKLSGTADTIWSG